MNIHASLICLWALASGVSAQGLGFTRDNSTLVITHAGKPLGTFVPGKPETPRPHFANLRAPGGTQVTRNQPPVPGQDKDDHATMHPGLWLAFGDISGVDFWRNKGRIEHVGHTQSRIDPVTGIFTFGTESRLLSPTAIPMGTLTNRLSLRTLPSGHLLIWDATFRAGEKSLVFGDQEEMGFGARLATPLIENNGGVITSSTGKKTARATWGQPADWIDYSGKPDGTPAGITLLASPGNFRPSWWHNRDYGLMVANPFGREAMRRGAKSAVEVKPGETLRLVFGAMLHDGPGYEPTQAHAEFLRAVGPHKP